MTQKYKEIYQESIKNREDFWKEISNDIFWYKKPTKILNSQNPPFYKWFEDGVTNTCYNALDLHVDQGKGEKLAIIYDSPITGSKENITYNKLKEKVALFAGALKKQGVSKGDRVIIYMPMIPEAVVAMLACGRIGAVHSVVFGGFAANELASRIDDSKAKILVTASCGYEPGRTVHYKPLVNKALELANHKIKRCIIFQREKDKAELNPEIDIIADDWSVNTCSDLDMDGAITVSDIGLLVNCLENSEQFSRDNQSEPCEFGLEITNPSDTVTLSIGELNLEEGYVDIYILNPNNEVLGYQFEMGNISINSVQNLVSDYPIEPSFSPNGGMVLGVSYEDSLIVKNYEPAPLCRIYYSSIESNTCIESIIDIVNQDYENVITINNTESCQGVSVENYHGNSIAMYPNPATDLLAVKLALDKNSDVSISINNMLGQNVFKEDFYLKDLYTELDVSEYRSGLYIVKINVNKQVFTKPLVIE